MICDDLCLAGIFPVFTPGWRRLLSRADWNYLSAMTNEALWLETTFGELVNVRQLAQIQHDGQGKVVGFSPALGKIVLYKGSPDECERIREELGATLQSMKITDLSRVSFA